MYDTKMAMKVFLIMLAFQDSLCLRDVQIMVPEAAVRGRSVELRCEFDLEREVLYSVKWYRGDREFCRFSPRDVPPLKIFPIPGLDVDRAKSSSRRLTIKNATDVANGHYTCEVSADAPSFQTARVHGFMYVVDIPTSDPTLTGLKRRYRPGMKLRAECISRNSMPASNLSFYINDEEALSQHVWHRVDGDKGGPMTAYSTIQFVLQKHHFVMEKIRLRCTAIIYSAYRMSIEKVADQERIRTTPSSLLDDHDTFIYSVHRRLPQTNASATQWTASTALLKAVSIISLFLPTVLS